MEEMYNDSTRIKRSDSITRRPEKKYNIQGSYTSRRARNKDIVIEVEEALKDHNGYIKDAIEPISIKHNLGVDYIGSLATDVIDEYKIRRKKFREEQKKLLKKNRKRGSGGPKTVYGWDNKSEDKTVYEFVSIIEAAEYIGVNSSNVSRVANLKYPARTIKGWSFIKKEDMNEQ